MSTATHPLLRMISGDVKTLSFTAVDGDGDAINLTGVTEITFKLWALDADDEPTGAALVDENIAGDTHLDTPASGTFGVDLVNSDTAALAGTYGFEFELTDASGNKRNTGLHYIEIIADLTA